MPIGPDRQGEALFKSKGREGERERGRVKEREREREREREEEKVREREGERERERHFSSRRFPEVPTKTPSVAEASGKKDEEQGSLLHQEGPIKCHLIVAQDGTRILACQTQVAMVPLECG